MVTDPLKEFRGRIEKDEDEGPVRGATGKLVYEAFDAKDKVIRLDIHRAAGPSHALPYGYLLDVVYGRRFYTKVMLVYRFMLVRLTGTNLREVVLALKQHRAEFLQEFSAAEFEAPASDAPLIERIEVISKDMAEAMSEADAELGEPEGV